MAMEMNNVLFKKLGFSLKVLADFINQLPFWVPIGGVAIFSMQNEQYL